jgi:hypothetical protein
VSAPWRWLLPLPGLLLLAACETPPPLPHTVLVRAELARLVADEQPPCGAVREYTRHGRLDYRVECESGRVYRVQVGADGRVTIKPYTP